MTAGKGEALVPLTSVLRSSCHANTHAYFCLEPTFISHTHEGDGVSQSRLPLLLSKCPEKPDSYLRVIAMGMGLSRTWLAQTATSFHCLRISLSAKGKIQKQIEKSLLFAVFVAINRGQASTVLSDHRNKEQRKRTQQRSATMSAVFLLCVLRDTLCLTPVMGCAHMDDHRACRVTSVHTLSKTTKED